MGPESYVQKIVYTILYLPVAYTLRPDLAYDFQGLESIQSGACPKRVTDSEFDVYRVRLQRKLAIQASAFSAC